jgi:hypothetical protein
VHGSGFRVQDVATRPKPMTVRANKDRQSFDTIIRLFPPFFGAKTRGVRPELELSIGGRS